MDVESDNIDGDEILQEIDIYFSNSLSDDLILLQYPLKPAWRPYDVGFCQEVRIKPHLEVIEVDYSIPTDEIMTGTRKEMVEGEEELEFHTVRSSRIPLQTNYAVGVHKDNAIHLTAIPKIYQMRPDFNHINVQAEMKKKKTAEREKQDKDKDGEMDDEDDVVLSSLPVRVTQESERARYVREHSWEHIKKNEETEKWTILKLIEKEDEKSDRIFSRLMTVTDDPVACELNPTQYVNLIAYPVVAPIIDPSLVPEISWSQIKEMPLDKMILNVMLKVHILQHKEALELVESCHIKDANDLKVHDALKSCANVVKGVWVVKGSSMNLSPVKLHCRNYILSQFALSDSPIEILTLAESLGQPTSFVKDIILPYAHPVNRKWELKKEPDVDFLQKYSKTCEGYLKTWSANVANLLQESLSQLEMPSMDDRNDRHSNLKGILVSSPEHERELNYFLNNLFHTYGVVSMPVLKQKLNKAFKASEFKMVTKDHIANQQLIDGILHKIADTMHGGYYLKTKSSNAEDEKYRAAIIEIFKEKIVLIKKDINTAIKRITGKNIPEATYMKMLREFAYFKQNKWIFKSGNLSEESEQVNITDDDGAMEMGAKGDK
jgi:hypothetical protein